MKKTRYHAAVLSVVLMTLYGLSGKLFLAQLQAAEKVAPKHPRKKGAAPTAASLVKDMQKAVAFIALSAKGKINVKSKEARPFWSALKDCSKSLDLLEEGVKEKNEKMIQGLDQLGGGMVQLAASWGILRGSHPNLQVGRGVIALNEAYETYLFHFGPASARFHKGGKISEAEAQKIAKCRKELEKIDAAIDALKSKAKPKSYEARIVADLIRLSNELSEVDAKTLKGFCKFVYQWDRLKYALEGYGDVIEVWYPHLASEWKSVDSQIKVMSTEFTSETWSYYESWSYTSVSVEQYGSYYEKTAAVSSVTESEETSIETSIESYSEESATEESESEAAEINEEVEVDEDDDTAMYEEVEDGEDDEDGDGISDEEDTDDDNDGVNDADDDDDDGDGVSDAEDEDESDDDDSMSDDGGDDDSDDDGVPDSDDGDDGGDE